MSPTLTKVVLRWGLGVSAGTILVALTSPLFVRSYSPTPVDPVRNVWTLQPDSIYRWRSEGYADTYIGPLGMPGVRKLDLASESSKPGFAFWGDSQAEGVGVSDDVKIFAIAERLSSEQGNSVRVYPLARSGDDVRDWLAQMPQVESHLKLTGHVMLVVDLTDLIVATGPAKTNYRGEFGQTISKLLPAFVIQSVRNVFYDEDGFTPRSLRFSVGPVVPTMNADTLARNDLVKTISTRDTWSAVFATLRNRTSLPIVVLYAPPIPVIMQGRVQAEDDNAGVLPEILDAAHRFNITWVDLRPSLMEVSLTGRWPRGFHNGQFGVGHLNALGNDIVARSLVDAVNQVKLEN